mmetsp:Transcript_20724/g.43571  ORF Transcript_20724/g.43571 Transcript_20724/m.43571 type:complete len:208 (-) Transcript_20724:643-1266(-)
MLLRTQSPLGPTPRRLGHHRLRLPLLSLLPPLRQLHRRLSGRQLRRRQDPDRRVLHEQGRHLAGGQVRLRLRVREGVDSGRGDGGKIGFYQVAGGVRREERRVFGGEGGGKSVREVRCLFGRKRRWGREFDALCEGVRESEMSRYREERDFLRRRRFALRGMLCVGFARLVVFGQFHPGDERGGDHSDGVYHHGGSDAVAGCGSRCE